MVSGDATEMLQGCGEYTYKQGELRGVVGEERRGKEKDTCPLTTFGYESRQLWVWSLEMVQRHGGYTYEQGELRGRVGEDRRGKEIDGCPLTTGLTNGRRGIATAGNVGIEGRTAIKAGRAGLT
jgi:hypothetical protein